MAGGARPAVRTPNNPQYVFTAKWILKKLPSRPPVRLAPTAWIHWNRRPFDQSSSSRVCLALGQPVLGRRTGTGAGPRNIEFRIEQVEFLFFPFCCFVSISNSATDLSALNDSSSVAGLTSIRVFSNLLTRRLPSRRLANRHDLVHALVKGGTARTSTPSLASTFGFILRRLDPAMFQHVGGRDTVLWILAKHRRQ